MRVYKTRKEIEAVQWFPGIAIEGVNEAGGCAVLENNRTILPGDYVVKLGTALHVVPELLFCTLFEAEPKIKDQTLDIWSSREPRDEPRD